ncbi:MAG: DUF3102 domain-containing protein [Xanthobacteraceae bacterium]
MTEERTLSLKQLATEINRAYQQIIDGEKKSIEYATEIGEMLIAAKKQHGEHGKWLAWLKAECPQIAETTAALYMRIAKNGDVLAAAVEANGQRVADLTIRGAAKLLAKPKNPNAPPRQRKVDEEPAPHGVSSDLPTLLESVDVDELVTALQQAKWDVEKVRKLASTLTARLTPNVQQRPMSQPSATSSAASPR